MGDTMMGSSTNKGNINMLDPNQMQQFSSMIQNLGPEAQQALGGLMQGQSMEDMQSMFQQNYVDPAQQAMTQKIAPSIMQSFGDANAGSSSALNQALSQSASDMSASLGSQFGQFMQGQQGNQLQALSQFLPMLSQQNFAPHIQERAGLAGPLAQGVGQGAGMVGSAAINKYGIGAK